MNREVICFDASRSREGAWIEISVPLLETACTKVAPARERGLKLLRLLLSISLERSRSREGAWIEIVVWSSALYLDKSRSREGAWIEIAV